MLVVHGFCICGFTCCSNGFVTSKSTLPDSVTCGQTQGGEDSELPDRLSQLRPQLSPCTQRPFPQSI